MGRAEDFPREERGQEALEFAKPDLLRNSRAFGWQKPHSIIDS